MEVSEDGVTDPLGRSGDWRAVDRRWVKLQQLREWLDSLALVAVIAANGCAAASSFGFSDLYWASACAVLFVAFALQSQLWPPYAWRFHGLRVLPDGIEVHRGALFRKVTTVPRWRVQHVDVTQGPLERRLGLARLVIHTAGARSSVEIAGLAQEDAASIRDGLMQERLGDGD